MTTVKFTPPYGNPIGGSDEGNVFGRVDLNSIRGTRYYNNIDQSYTAGTFPAVGQPIDYNVLHNKTLLDPIFPATPGVYDGTPGGEKTFVTPPFRYNFIVEIWGAGGGGGCGWHDGYQNGSDGGQTYVRSNGLNLFSGSSTMYAGGGGGGGGGYRYGNQNGAGGSAGSTTYGDSSSSVGNGGGTTTGQGQGGYGGGAPSGLGFVVYRSDGSSYYVGGTAGGGGGMFGGSRNAPSQHGQDGGFPGGGGGGGGYSDYQTGKNANPNQADGGGGGSGGYSHYVFARNQLAYGTVFSYYVGAGGAGATAGGESNGGNGGNGAVKFSWF